jgi:hypothetical protein
MINETLQAAIRLHLDFRFPLTQKSQRSDYERRLARGLSRSVFQNGRDPKQSEFQVYNQKHVLTILRCVGILPPGMVDDAHRECVRQNGEPHSDTSQA